MRRDEKMRATDLNQAKQRKVAAIEARRQSVIRLYRLGANKRQIKTSIGGSTEWISKTLREAGYEVAP